MKTSSGFVAVPVRVASAAAQDPVLVGAGDIADCAQPLPAPPRRRSSSTASRERSSRSATTRTRAARRSSSPTATRRRGAGTRRARVRPSAITTTGPRTPARYFEYFGGAAGDPDEGLLRLRPRRVARRRDQQQLRGGRRLRPRFAPGRLAPGRPRGPPDAAARPRCGTTRASPPAASTATIRRCTTSGRCSRTRAPSSSSPATSTTTSDSRRRTPTADPIRSAASASSWSERAAASSTPGAAIKPTARSGTTETFGVLKLTLHPDGYDWEFLPVDGETFTDKGTDKCH